MAAWDAGIRWSTQVAQRDPDFYAIPLDLAKSVCNIVRPDQDVLLYHYIKAATAFGERLRGEHIEPKTMTMTLSGFPVGGIEFSDVPVREIVSVDYVDGDGTTQAYGGSPPEWVFLPAGRDSRARLLRIPGGEWPATYAQDNSVVVTFTVGYETDADVPAELAQAIAVTVGEFYKSPDLSNGDESQANVLNVAHFWPRHWGNGF